MFEHRCGIGVNRCSVMGLVFGLQFIDLHLVLYIALVDALVVTRFHCLRRSTLYTPRAPGDTPERSTTPSRKLLRSCLNTLPDPSQAQKSMP